MRPYFQEIAIPSLLIIEERSYSSASFFGKTIFSEHLQKMSYFHVFFEKDHPPFFVQRLRSYFWEKEI